MSELEEGPWKVYRSSTQWALPLPRLWARSRPGPWGMGESEYLPGVQVEVKEEHTEGPRGWVAGPGSTGKRKLCGSGDTHVFSISFPQKLWCLKVLRSCGIHDPHHEQFHQHEIKSSQTCPPRETTEGLAQFPHFRSQRI